MRWKYTRIGVSAYRAQFERHRDPAQQLVGLSDPFISISARPSRTNETAFSAAS
jgi:hypothetical protein